MLGARPSGKLPSGLEDVVEERKAKYMAWLESDDESSSSEEESSSDDE